MKYRSLLMGATLAAALISTGAQAEETEAGFYLGLKAGKTKIDVEEVDDGSGKGFFAGYAFDGGFAMEFEWTETETEFELPGYPFSYNDDMDITTYALYGAWRSSGTVYFKGKLGILHESVDTVYVEETDTAGSVGLGGGVRIGEHVFVEAEYTIIEADVDFLSVGLGVKF